MRILVTGILGFVAGYVTDELLKKEHQVIGVDIIRDDEKKRRADTFPKAVNVRHCDLSELSEVESLLEESSPDWVIHLAAQSSAAKSLSDPHLTFVSNAIGGLNLLESMRKKGYSGRALFVGSSEVYGKRKERVPVTEDAEFRPTNPYAASKAAQDLLAEQYSLCYDLDVIRTRSFGHTGPGQTTVFAIPNFAEQIALMGAGKRDPVLEVGNLDVVRDYTDVRDVAKAYIVLLEKGKRGEAYNVSSGKGNSMRDIVSKMVELSGLKVELKTLSSRVRKTDIQYLVGDNTKLKREIGWKASIELDETLSSVLEYWRNRVKERASV